RPYQARRLLTNRRLCEGENRLETGCGFFTLLRLRRITQKWIRYAHRAIPATVLKVFRKNFRQAVVFGVGPKMGIIPGESIRRHAEQRCTKDAFVGVEHLEISHEAFSLPDGFIFRQQGSSVTLPARNHGYKFD